MIDIGVEDGVVTLDGDVPVLAWWAPGSRDVVKGLGVDRVVNEIRGRA